MLLSYSHGSVRQRTDRLPGSEEDAGQGEAAHRSFPSGGNCPRKHEYQEM